MIGCSYVESCPLVNSLTPSFPMALAMLRQKHCAGDYMSCSRYQLCEAGRGDTLIYADVALVVALVESCMNRVAEQWG